MRAALTLLVVWIAASMPAWADVPSGYAIGVSTTPALEGFSVRAVDSVRSELQRGEVLDVTTPDGRFHGLDPEALRALGRARGLYTLGREAYDNLDLGVAISRLERCVDLFESSSRALEDFDIFIDALLRLGAAHVLNGDPRAAEAVFTRVYTLAPQRRPDPEIYPDQVTSLFESVADRVQRAGTGTLEIRTEPQGAYVYVDGAFRGRAPAHVDELLIGTHLVRVRAPGHVDQAGSGVVRARRSQTLSVTLVPIEGMQDLPESVARLSPDSTPGAVEMVGRLVGASRIALLIFAPARQDEVKVEVRVYEVGSPRAPVGRSFVVSADADGLEDVVASSIDLVRRAGAGGGQAITTVSDPHDPTPVPLPPTGQGGGVTSKWWFWTGLGLAVAGGVVLTVVLAGGSEEGHGDGSTGEYVFRF